MKRRKVLICVNDKNVRQIYETHVESACRDVFLNCVISSSSCLDENLWDIKLTK